MNEIGTSVREREIYKVTLVGSLVNILLVVCKFAAGFGGKSAAMIADAVHSLSDLITDLIVIVFVRISSKPEDKGHDYGHGKYETLATLLIGAALLAVGAGICWSGVESIISFAKGETLQSPGWVALAAAVVSVVSDSQCLASPQRCIFFHRYGRRYWRSYPVGRKLACA